ncbi:tetratricopeptide repeat protein [Halalkalibacillus halophilus]|uniref:tetratricopeptide repeat protein n=1 Tax=Halalkalibacillus halophilus TaxID=392827 RepID=UPI00040E5C81|nr:tetratricopeptide repeat protein [Halalkalibacillus halophilus]
MDKKVGRNDPCPCGSGKKYKKCCENDNVISFNQDHVKKELAEIWEEVMQHSIEKYPQFMEKADQSNMMDVLKQLHLTLAHANKEGEVARFVTKKQKQVKRKSIYDTLEEWKNVTFTVLQASESISMDDQYVKVEDYFTGEKWSLYKGSMSSDEIKKGEYISGHCLKWLDEVRLAPLGIPGDQLTMDQINKQLQLRKDENSRKLLNAYLQDALIIWFEAFDNSAYDRISAFPKAKQVMDELLQRIGTTSKHSEEKELIQMMWLNYFRDKQPNFNKPTIMAGALHYYYNYFILSPHKQEDLTIKALANLYNVSASSLSKRIDDIIMYGYELFERANEELQGPEMMDEGSDQMEIDPFQNSSTSTSKSEANYMIFDVIYNQDLSEQEKSDLLSQALELDPENVDGIMVLADMCEESDEKENILKHAINVATKAVDFDLLETIEYPWAVHEARPYFIASHRLAQFYREEGRMSEAIKLMEKLVEWNEEDNIGVRYGLIPLLIQEGHLDDAELLLDMYEEEESTHMLYNLALYLIAKEASKQRIHSSLKKAKSLNSKVPKYLKNKKKTQQAKVGMGFTLGGEEEAIDYAKLAFDAWQPYVEYL